MDDDSSGSSKLSGLTGFLPCAIAAFVAINTNKPVLDRLGFNDTLAARIVAGVVIFTVTAVSLAVAFTFAARVFRRGNR